MIAARAGRSSVHCEPPSARGGGWASAIFSPGSGGLARPFWSRPIEFAWALPLGVVALPAVLAFFPAAGFAIARLLWSPGPSRVFALAFGLGARRMGARPPLHRLSLERPRHGARRQSCPGADRLACRPARAHFPHDRDFRRAGDALASGREPPQSGADGRRRAGARADRRFRRVQAVGAGQSPLFPASSCASSSPTSARTPRSPRKIGRRSCAATSTCRSARRRRIDRG